MNELHWRPASEHGNDFVDGEQMLVAVGVCSTPRGISAARREWWEVSSITICCDDGRFEIRQNGEYWGWDWSDVEWWVPLSEIVEGLPMLTAKAAEEDMR